MTRNDQFSKKAMKEKITKGASLIKKSARFSRSALNGIIGDTLEKRKNSLSIQMNFVFENHFLELNKKNLKEQFPQIKSKICILVHGLLTDEKLFNFPDDDCKNYGSLLEKEEGFTSFYVRYNSGLHISENGKKLSNLISFLSKEYPKKVTEIVFIAHSMGGLVVHSACDFATKSKEPWIKKVRKIFFLGTPHLGAPLEKFGNLASSVLKVLPLPFMKFSRNILNLRSAGIKDLRFGYTSEEDWIGKNPDAFLENNKKAIPLIAGIDYYVLTGTITKDPRHILSSWFGDSLVRKPSALGKSIHQERSLEFPLENIKEFPKISHMRLAHNIKIYEQVKTWIKD